MTNQEKIREGIQACVDKYYCTFTEDTTRDIIKYLHSQGVVIRVDRELPKADKREVGDYLKRELGFSDTLIGCMRDDVARYINKKVRTMLKAGYVAVEPLIKGAK